MTAQTVKTANDSVHVAWKDLRTDLTRIIQGKGGEVRSCGVTYWEKPIAIDTLTGRWAERSTRSKPNRWLFTYNHETAELKSASRIGYFSLRTEALAYVVRIFVSIKGQEDQPYTLNDGVEWLAVFVAKSLTPRGSSSAIARADDLDEGILAISSDDRKYGVALACCALIPPLDKIKQHSVATVHNSLVNKMQRICTFFDLSKEGSKETFLTHVDSISLQSALSSVTSKEKSWLSEGDMEHCLALFEKGQSNMVLWGNERSNLDSLVWRLCQDSQISVMHLEALPTWNQGTIVAISQQVDLSNKVVFLHCTERLDPELVLPVILERHQSLVIYSPDGSVAKQLQSKPRAWILILCKPFSDQIRRLHRVVGDTFRWFRFEAAPLASEAVRKIYQEENVAVHNKQWSNNLFVLMWDDLQSHVNIAPEALAPVVRTCLRKDPTDAWDVDSSPVAKEHLVQAIEAHLSPHLATAPFGVRKACINSLINTLEVPLSSSGKIVALILAD